MAKHQHPMKDGSRNPLALGDSGGKSLQAIASRLRTAGVVATKDLDAAQKRAPGKRSSAKRYLNQK